MRSIPNTGATARADCPDTTSGEKYSHSPPRALQAEGSKPGKQHATTKAAEPEDLQVSFAWRLPPHDSTIRYHRLVLYSAGELSLASGQICLISIIYQSEREHRTSKGRYLRTSGRSIPQQLAKIEQRQRYIRMIRENLNLSHPQRDPESVIVDPNARYNMGTSQKFPVHIPTFLQRNEGDPAIKVRTPISFYPLPLTPLAQNFLPKLRSHLLRRVQATLELETRAFDEFPCDRRASDSGPSANPDANGRDFVFFKGDRIYHHKLLRFNFMTYAVRCGTDVVNPGTSRCNVMLLSADCADGSASNSHHFLYARVLGAYHANVVYTGPGMRDYKARRFDFLWVRWYEYVDPGSSGWGNSSLDSVRFPPLNDDESFGFVDPVDVLCGCHIIPAFSSGKRQETRIDVSRCAKDSKDYKRYYIGRYAQQYHYESGVDLDPIDFLTGIFSCDTIGALVLATFMRIDRHTHLAACPINRWTLRPRVTYLPTLKHCQPAWIYVWTQRATCATNMPIQRWFWRTVTPRVGMM